MSPGTRDEVEIFPDAGVLAAAVAEHIVAAAAVAIRARGAFVLALSGGSTPRRTYERLASASVAPRVSWKHVRIVWGDERCVPPDDAASNYRMARETLLDHAPVPEANVHRIHGEDDPALAAARYETTIREVLATPAGPPATIPGSRIDLALLGLGADGHTASIFPGGAAIGEERRWCVAERADAAAMWRITLTPLILNAAATVLFIVAGSAKAAITKRVLDGPVGAPPLPAQRIVPSSGRRCWRLDAAAAAQLASTQHA